MDIKKIDALARIMNKNGLTELKVSEGDFKLSMRRASGVAAEQPAAQLPQPQPVEKPLEQKEKSETKSASFSGLTEVTAPLAGVFYAAPAPDAEPFVKVGDKVKKGDVLCIIEAMKIMNEITADRDGEIADICVKNEQIVEYGQTLFTMY
ncbi:MAG TPA: acetyl-CoA carboxylase biotin carboxyl carrier protein [Bacillota bacterium]|nr:acetyl-CoA carboxylase biotin carboxyl carrier protein [Bacillota bacterium]HOK69060.1 acetyl-CoA carboxylase biotin carboxyl carrier protein [Bacillota bacterium]HPP85837.1 acetyl-CoA carboxylase biotin carboxyl carrier protein [Bacillota bacterium]